MAMKSTSWILTVPMSPADEQSGRRLQPDWSPMGRNRVLQPSEDNFETLRDERRRTDPLSNQHSGSDSRPAWSPDGSKIAFDSDRDELYHAQVYVMNADGSNQVPLTTMTYNVDPTWSPDGARIAFSTLRWGHYEICAMNADGSNQTRLTNSMADSLFPSWSPDGSRIAFRTSYTGDAEIYSMDPDGSNLVNLTNNSSDDVIPNWQKVPGVFPTPTSTPTATPGSDPPRPNHPSLHPTPTATRQRQLLRQPPLRQPVATPSQQRHRLPLATPIATATLFQLRCNNAPAALRARHPWLRQAPRRLQPFSQAARLNISTRYESKRETT